MAANKDRENRQNPKKASVRVMKLLEKQPDPEVSRFVPRIRRLLQKAKLILDD